MATTWRAMAGGLALLAAAAGVEAATLEVVVINHAVPPLVLRTAQDEASRIYALAGIQLVWFEAMSEPPQAGGARLMVRVTSSAPAGLRNILGFASHTEHKRGTVATVFAGRVRNFARGHNASVAQVLGLVMAHEMGHLLLSFHSHAETGIMRGEWERADLRAANTQMLFSADQAERLRRRVGAAGAN